MRQRSSNSGSMLHTAFDSWSRPLRHVVLSAPEKLKSFLLQLCFVFLTISWTNTKEVEKLILILSQKQQLHNAILSFLLWDEIVESLWLWLIW